MNEIRRSSFFRFWVALQFLLAAIVGCASSQTAKTADYKELYDERRYSEAYTAALEAQTRGSTVQKENAALVAGLSAAALGKNDQAEKILRPLLSSGDKTISGEAAAQLGLMAFEKERHAEAVQLLTKASDQLSGDEAARSSLYAGDAWRAQGRITDARLMYERAQSQVKNDSTLKVLISDRLAAVSGQQRDGSGTFTVQIGAFSTFIRAQMQADRYRARAQSAGLSTPRIVQTINTQGAKVYAVRVGRFTTRGAADAARQALGSEARIMTVSKE